MTIKSSDPAYRFVVAANEKEARNKALRDRRKPAHPAISMAVGTVTIFAAFMVWSGGNGIWAAPVILALAGLTNLWYGYRDLRKMRAVR